MSHEHLKNVFENGAKLHNTIISELSSYIAINEGSANSEGTLKGKTTQIIGQLKTVIQHTDYTLVRELQKIEQVTNSKFEMALNKNLPRDAKSLIGKQIMRLKNNHDHLINLEYYLENTPSD